MRRKITFLNSIFTKFALAFIVVGILPLGLMTFVILGKVPGELEKYTISNFEQMLLYAGSNVEKKITDYDNSSKLIYKYSSGVNGQLDTLLRDDNASNKVITQRNVLVNDLVMTVLYSDQFIENVFFVDAKSNLISYETKNGKTLDIHYQFVTSSAYQQTLLNPKALSVFPSHTEDYFVKSNQKVLTFSRNYLDVSALPFEEILRGTILIDVSISVFDGIFNKLSLGEAGKIYLLDGLGNCVYSPEHNEIGSSFKSYLTKVKGFETLQEKHIKTFDGYLFFEAIEGTDWLLVADIPQTSVINQVTNINHLIRIILIGCSIGLILMAMLFSRNLSRPIKSIIRQMKKVEAGNFDIQVEVTSHDEVKQLAETFNNMTTELKGYINKAYVAQIKQKEAELTAIKTQISPHYLYNTLEVIRMGALDEDANTTADMICALSAQLKYTIGYSDDVVFLGQEIEHVTHYFNILKVRFEDRFSLEVHIPESFYKNQVLKLMLQPIVENAVTHGLRPKVGKGKVMIKGHIQDRNLEIFVYDDGVGMDDVTLKAVVELLNGDKMGNESPEGWSNIGVKNVHDRLKLKYGEQYGIEITSKKQLGTIVKLKMPLIAEEGENHDQNDTGR